MSLTNVMQCKMAKDQCHRTANYKRPGQNLYETCASSSYVDTDDTIGMAIKSWYDQHNRLSEIYQEHSVDNEIIAKSGSYLQIIKNNADRIGCSIIKYLDPRDYTCTLFGCNYNAGNVVGIPTYNVGPSASLCTTGPNTAFPGLCSVNEDFTKHALAEIFFKNESPVVAEWIKRGKYIVTGGRELDVIDNREFE